MDQHAVEELFERNADMRLLERRHADVGIARTDGATRRTGGTFGAESIVAGGADPAALEGTSRMRVTIAAVPASGVIPGALVGVAVDVFNDGNAPAPESRLLLALPIDCEYRAGTLRVDGREPPAPERLFETGLAVPRLPGETSAKVTFQLHVLPGLNALFLQPRLQTQGVPVVGTPGIAVKRGTIERTAAAPEPPRPFYELEADEDDDEGALSESELPLLPPVLHEKPATETPAESAGAESLAEAIEPEPVVQIELTEASPEPAVAAPSAPTDESAARCRPLAAGDVALLERLFAAEHPGTVAHFVAISTLACTQTPDGGDPGGFDAFVRRDLEALGRALVLVRLGKPPAYRVDQGDLDALGTATPAAAQPQRRDGTPLQLRRDLRRSESAAVAALLQRSDRDPALRIRIALLAHGAAALERVDDARPADDCTVALATYRAHALAWLVPLCALSAGQSAFELPPPPTALDVAARGMTAALRAAVG